MTTQDNKPTSLREIVDQIHRGYAINGTAHNDDELIDLGVAAIAELYESAVPERRQGAEFIVSYSYDYVQDGNLDDLCEYVSDKSSDWGFNNAIDEIHANFKQIREGK